MIVPIELTGHIFRYLSQQHLYHICLVSRLFYEEAKAHLYSDIILRNFCAVESWSDTIRQTPVLAKHARRIVIYFPQQIRSLPSAADPLWCIIQYRLRSCIDLEDLRLHMVDDQHSLSTGTLDPEVILKGGRGMPPQSYMLEGMTFKLKSFVNDYFPVYMLGEFLKSQPDIEFLSLKREGLTPLVTSAQRESPSTLTPGGIRDLHIPPSVMVLDTTMKVVQNMRPTSVTNLQIERLQVDLVIPDRDSSLLYRLGTLNSIVNSFEPTLRVLSIRQEDLSDNDGVFMFIRTIADRLPRLQFLKISDYTIHRRTISLVGNDPLPNRSELETLIIRPPVFSPPKPLKKPGRRTKHEVITGPGCAYLMLRNQPGRIFAAEQWMKCFTKLKRFDLILGSGDTHRFLRSSRDLAYIEGVKIDNDDWLQL